MAEMKLPLTQKIPIDCFRHSPCIDLAYTEVGTGEALVLIHGLGGNGWSWRQQLEALSHDYRVITLDLRGHGQSGYRAEEAVSIRTLAADVVALVQWLGISQAHFCGNSLGGLLTLEIWVRAPSLMKSLVLADTTAFFPPPSMLEEFLGLFDRLDMSAWAKFIAPRLLRPGAPAALTEEVEEMIAATPRTVYRKALVASFLADYRWMLPLIDLPTLILVGALDQATPLGYARYMASRISNSTLQVVPEAAHLAPRENSEEFNRQVKVHLQKAR